MQKLTIRSALALSIVVGGLAAASPASATGTNKYRNLKNNTMCLGVSGGSGNLGTQIIIWECDGSANQNWTEQFFPLALGFNYYFTGQTRSGTSPPAADMVLAVAGGTITNNKDVIDYTVFNPAHGDQGWKKTFATNDSSMKPCYSFTNFASPSGHPYVLGTLNGGTTHGTHVVIHEQYLDAFGLPDFGGHAEQYWCMY